MKKITPILAAIAFIISCASSNDKDISGQWHGSVEIQGTEMPLIFNIKKEGGDYVATMDSPKQGAKGIPAKTVTLVGNTLTIEIPTIGFTYEGELKDDGTVEGGFTQLGQKYTMNLVIQQGEAASTLNRPQEPKPPYSYISEDVTFRNGEAEINLAGTITIPKGEGKYPAVVLVTGSGPQNRDEELLGHKPFLVLADYLTRNGVAVLRYDDRGVGESGGVYREAGISDFASDAWAATIYLKNRKEVDPLKVGIIGHSEGGAVAFMLAAEHKDLAFIVSMAGPAVKGAELMKEQRRLIFSAMKMPQSSIDKNEKSIQDMNKLVLKYTADSLFRFPDKFIKEIMPENLKENAEARMQYKTQLMQFASPAIQSLLSFDPTTMLGKIKCPALAIYGEKDLQVPADMNIESIKAHGKSNFETKKYPELNHLFQHAQTGLPTEYESIEETISPEVLQDIADWVKRIIKQQK